ncbi:ComF family protein [Tepidibacter formicigenes]|jgi:competence protein ComFC|uniref:Competence protein ComFC n=1 Tax=Tepidibacter formicigenes DSM 15518 TaxID=1123349 RepID=A0A1M6P159_9FIRM|nr:ComF family protein [Tepidibacter formicigenes]SHK01695.1 competence protein ComFC [Tepidibacter formicigenes DSM 15518]
MIDTLLDYIYPRNIKCIICKNPIPKTNPYSLCKSCFNEINFIKNGCIKCGKPLTLFYKEEICFNCKKEDYFFERALSCVEYNDNIHRLMYSFKYGRKTYLAYPIAKVMMDKLKYEYIDFDYIIPVPIHKKRQRKRGFNQSLLIATNLGKITSKEVLDILYRKKYTRFLSNLSKKDRKNELKDVFTIKENEHKIIKKNILLVDDIFTTGSTVDEISKILIKHGSGKIYVLTFTTGKNIY